MLGLPVGHSTSAAEELQATVPQGNVVKAFNTVFAQVVGSGARAQVLYAGDDAGAAVEDYIARASSLHPLGGRATAGRLASLLAVLTRSPMPPIRVVLGTMPVLLGDIVRDTLSVYRDEVEVIAQVRTRAEMASAIQRTEAHVAVLAFAHQDWGGLSDFL